ncbi:MAG: DUF2489 domain-containing protein [Aestuariibacter sp.]
MALLSDNWHIFLAIAAVIVLALVGYLIFVLAQLKQQRNQQKYFADKLLHTCCDSMHTIIAATLQQQCNISEATIRIKAIADTLNQQATDTLDLSICPQLLKLHNAIQSHPVLEARKQLPRNERMKLDLQREALEADLESDILRELQQIQVQIAALKSRHI